MKRGALVFAVTLTLLAGSAAQAQRHRPARRPLPPPQTVFKVYDFSLGGLGWKPGFADNNPLFSEDIISEVRLVPRELGSHTAWYLSGWNRSDDLFLYIARDVPGLNPWQNYLVDFEVTFASNVGKACGGVGGAPGEAVYLKLGVAPFEPKGIPDSSGALRMNLDKGNQQPGGVHGSMAGTLSAPTSGCGGSTPYVRVRRNHQHPYAMPASSSGQLWMIFGYDSGHESFNDIYIERIEARFVPVPPGHASTRWQPIYGEMAKVVADLKALGVEIEETSRTDDPIIGGRVIHHLIGAPGDSEELYFHIYDNHTDARRASQKFSRDASSFDTTTLFWRLPPHLYLTEQTIVIYLGSSMTVQSYLTTRYGPQFAGQ